MSSAEIESSAIPSDGDAALSSTRDPVEVAREAAGKATRQAKRRADSFYARAAAAAASTANETSDVIDDASNALGSAGHEALSKAGAALSDRMRSFSAYVEDGKLQDLIRDAYRLAQRNPALMIGGGVALGFALARFVKTSAGAAKRRDRR